MNNKCNPDAAYGGNAGKKGITLVEVVVSAFILILSLTALLLLFSRTTQSAEAARRQLQALQIVRTELEQFRSTNYLNITSYPAVLLSDSFFVPLAGKKQCSVLETNGYKKISMIISWKSSAGSQIVTQTFYTIICSTN